MPKSLCIGGSICKKLANNCDVSHSKNPAQPNVSSFSLLHNIFEENNEKTKAVQLNKSWNFLFLKISTIFLSPYLYIHPFSSTKHITPSKFLTKNGNKNNKATRKKKTISQASLCLWQLCYDIGTRIQFFLTQNNKK